MKEKINNPIKKEKPILKPKSTEEALHFEEARLLGEIMIAESAGNFEKVANLEKQIRNLHR